MREFIHCPRCGGVDIEDTDYEEEDDDGELVVDDTGRHCNSCGWEGSMEELVSAD